MDEFDFESKPVRRGRPKSGEGVKIATRIPAELAARVRAFAAEHFLQYGDAVRALIERGLDDEAK